MNPPQRMQRGGSRRPFNSDTKVRVQFADHTRFYYPDAMVVCHSNPLGDHYQENPAVVVEVLSDSTRRVDQREKRDAYLTIPKLKLLILQESEFASAVVYRRTEEGAFGREEYGTR